MNTELFIAGRILFSASGKGGFSKPVTRIAVGGVALGMVVMILSIAIVTGFKKQISEKVIGFGSHIQISSFDANFSYESSAIKYDTALVASVNAIDGIKHIQIFATKPAIIKTKDEIQGVMLKGVGTDYDWTFLEKNLVSGSRLNMNTEDKSNEVIISKSLSLRLGLETGDDIISYFIQQPPRVRKFSVSGIYETGLEEFDNLVMLCDIRQIQKLNDWEPEDIGGLEIMVSDFGQIDNIGQQVYQVAGFNLNARTIREIYPQIFDWLDLQNINVIIIILLIIMVAGINMISALLILILERTSMIGLLKALGAQDASIRKVFIYVSAYLLGSGMFFGNLIGVGLSFLQFKFGLIKLPMESYYISVVPIDFTWGDFALLNLSTAVICIAMLIIPSIIITKVTPVKAIRFS